MRDFLMTTCGQCHMFAAHLRDCVSHTAMPLWNHFRVGKQRLRGQTGQRVASSELVTALMCSRLSSVQTLALRGQELLLTQISMFPSLFCQPSSLHNPAWWEGLCPCWRWGVFHKAEFFYHLSHKWLHPLKVFGQERPKPSTLLEMLYKSLFFFLKSSMCCMSDSHSMP